MRFRKLYDLLTPRQRRTAALLLVLTLIGMVLETLGLGLVIPVMALLTQERLAETYPALRGVLERLGNPTPRQLAVGGMLALLAVHIVRVGFLAFLAWRQMSFASAQQAYLSEQLFRVYLRQPYPFHLNRN